MKNSQNQQTLQSYEARSNEYISGTPHVISEDVSGWLDRALKGILTEGKILEIGAAFSREADYVESSGYSVQRTDATHDFVRLLKEQGHTAYVLNAITDDLGGLWDLIYANCVFLHFTKEELEQVLTKAFAALKTHAVLAFSVKRGKGSEWSNEKIGAPRFFQYYDQQTLNHMLVSAGFDIVDIRDGITAGDSNKIYAIAQKPSHSR